MRKLKRYYYKLPESFWKESKDDKILFNRNVTGRLPNFWHWQSFATLTGSDLSAIYRVVPSKVHMKAFLARWGPWSAPFAREKNPGPLDAPISYKIWKEKLLNFQRAYFLKNKLKRGFEFEEENWTERSGLPEYLGFPKRLKPQGTLPARFVATYRRMPEVKSQRSLVKALLASYIDEGMRSADIGFEYDHEEDTFGVYCTNKVRSLEAVCWLAIRDEAASLSGVRYCLNPQCGKALSPTMRADANTCRTSKCRKAWERLPADHPNKLAGTRRKRAKKA